ncbi:ankyrin repeat-containing domain protein [Chaetomium fimeti]|uniref:Ankyrin repeat-containing domain protein n=1 Tax=Chaetomium fimeti TaxID=1854472 RepID=A0AAE0H7B7_9PEZI|nr:ankyrin repeat-containing domain protein [Chaetomium fimeti]
MAASLNSLLKALVNRISGGLGDQYIYSPLSENGNIRLLRLMPHQNREAPLQCQLFEYPLRKARRGVHLYETLSYVWGSEENLKHVYIRSGDKNQRLLVTPNLHAALSHLRDELLERILWIDAICINQKDKVEKGLQVQFMAEIYANANRVIVWLGEAASDSDQAFEALRQAAREGSTQHYIDEPTEQAIFTLLERPWFRRIWVVQEAAAARQILMKCGPWEVDGFVFCSGIAALNLSYTTHPHLRGLIPPMTYLVRDAIFRPRDTISQPETSQPATSQPETSQPETSQPETSQPRTFSLNIRPLGELVDMYHNREATNRLDKVYALLGMSSDDHTTAELSVDYDLPWETVFRRLVQSLLSDQVFVDIWDDRAVAVIQGKGHICATVTQVDGHDTRSDIQLITITCKEALGNCKKWWSYQYHLRASANPIRVKDAVCILQGSTMPTIVRFHEGGYSTIIMITASLGEPDQRWSELIQSLPKSPTDFVMIWDWDAPQDGSQDQDYESLISSRGGPQRPWTESQDYLVKAIRLWNFGILLNGVEDYPDAGEHLRNAVEAYAAALRSAGTPPDYSAWTGADEEALMAMDNLVTGDEDAPVETERFNDLTPLLWAVEKGDEGLVKLLLEKGAVLDVVASSGQTPLVRAAEKGYIGVMKLLLDKGATIGAEAADGRMRLRWAVDRGYESAVKLLVDERISLDVDDDYYYDNDQDYADALQDASTQGYDNIVRILLDSDILATYSRSYGKAILGAVRASHDKIVQMLLEKGADLYAKGINLFSRALLDAADDSDGNMVRILLEKGADVNVEGGTFGNPLQTACYYGDDETVQMLLEKGADVNAQGGEYESALRAASSAGYNNIVRMLLENGANVNAQDDYSGNALYSASGAGHDEIVQMLLEKGANVNDQHGLYGNPLQNASFHGRDEIVQILLDNGADVNAQGGLYGNALQAASHGGHDKTVQRLLDNGANVNAQGGEHGNALFAASVKGHDKVVRVLLDWGADVDAQGDYYDTALQGAYARRHDHIVQILLENGAKELDWEPIQD